MLGRGHGVRRRHALAAQQVFGERAVHLARLVPGRAGQYGRDQRGAGDAQDPVLVADQCSDGHETVHGVAAGGEFVAGGRREVRQVVHGEAAGRGGQREQLPARVTALLDPPHQRVVDGQRQSGRGVAQTQVPLEPDEAPVEAERLEGVQDGARVPGERAQRGAQREYQGRVQRLACGVGQQGVDPVLRQRTEVDDPIREAAQRGHPEP